MELQFQKRWRSFRPDDITDFPDGAANVLIRRGIAIERLKPKKKRRNKPFIDDIPESIETL